MKRIIGNLLLAILVALLVIGFFSSRSQPHIDRELVQQKIPLKEIRATPPSARFLEMCSGIQLTEEVAPIATANCLGRIRGLSDGHLMTVRLAAADPSSRSNIQLWCINTTTTDKQVFDAVSTWTTENETRFNEIVSQYESVPTATMAVIVAALHAAYPCEK